MALSAFNDMAMSRCLDALEERQGGTTATIPFLLVTHYPFSATRWETMGAHLRPFLWVIARAIVIEILTVRYVL
jgi:hypothetical protein